MNFINLNILKEKRSNITQKSLANGEIESCEEVDVEYVPVFSLCLDTIELRIDDYLL